MSVTETQMLTIAEGSIDPLVRIAKGEIKSEELLRVREALLEDDVYTVVDPQIMLHPSVCSDGGYLIRSGGSAIAGTFSAVMGDALTSNRYREPGEKAPDHATRLYEKLQEPKQGRPFFKIGTHDDTNANGIYCGCGGEDLVDNIGNPQKPSILEYLTRRGDEIKSALSGLRNSKTNAPVGIEISEKLNDDIQTKAQVLRDEGYAVNGAALRAASVAAAGEESITTLDRVHVEGFLVIDTRDDRILNDEKLAAITDGKIKVFYVNVASLVSSAHETALDAQDEHERFIAMLYYNMAAAATLAGPGMEMLVL